MTERSEAPTPRRLSDARSKGQIAKSIEVNTALALLAAFWMLRGTLAGVWEQLEALIQTTFRTLPQTDLSPSAAGKISIAGVRAVFAAGVPFLLIMMAVGIVGNLAQTRGLFAPGLLKPDLNRLNPLNGIKRVLSKQGFVLLSKALLKILLLGWVAYSTLRGRTEQILALSQIDLHAAGRFFAAAGFALGTRAALAYSALAALDYVYEHRRWSNSLRMTKHEVKEEMKQAEGDPQLKQHIRQQQRRAARMRMFQEVPKADVIIVNPTHLAVALRYDRGRSLAPIVVAKGARLIAERIIELAREHGVPVIQNIPLARALYSGVEINQQIPAQLYKAVAEVLAFVFTLKARST